MNTPRDDSCPQEAAWSSTSRLPLSPYVKLADVTQAEECGTDYDQRYRRLLNQEIQERRVAHESAQRTLRDVIGEEHAYALRLRLSDLKAATCRRLEPPAGLDLDFTAVHRDRMAQASAFLRDRGVTEARIRAAAAGIPVPAPRHHLVDVHHITKVVAADQVPPAVMDHITPSPGFTLVHPPYGGWQQGRNGWGLGGFTWITQLVTQPETGFVANEIFLFDGDASDVDQGQYQADSQIVFWFIPPGTGLVEAWVELQCGKARHEVRLEDEWGFSNSRTQQANYVMMHVLHPNVTGPSLSETSRFILDSAETGTNSREYVSPGNLAFHHLFSDGPVTAGQPVVIRVGTRSMDSSFTNDVEVYSTSTFRWFIRSVQLRTTG
jgi:hypothetical protein